MIERTVTVKSAEFKDTKDGKKQYLSAVLMDCLNGKTSTQAIFDPAMAKTIQEARDTASCLLIHMEKEGEFWNIKSAEIAATPQTSKEPKPSYSNKDDEILMAVAFKGAIELETHLVPGAEPNTARVLQTTTELYVGLLLLRGREGK